MTRALARPVNCCSIDFEDDHAKLDSFEKEEISKINDIPPILTKFKEKKRVSLSMRFGTKISSPGIKIYPNKG